MAPEPLHPGVAASLENGLAQDADASPWQAHDENMIAFDRESVREIDRDGRLHANVSNISKANVCPYKGDANYFSIVTKSTTIKDAAWSYETPIESVSEIVGHLSFADDERITIEQI